MLPISVKNKVVWITASASGIGRATALRFAREGAHLILCDIAQSALAQTRADIEALGLGGKVVAQPYDASKSADIKKVFDVAMQTFGRIDVLVNNAGIAGPTKSIIETELEEWDQTFAVNLRGMFYCIKLVAPVMIQNGGGKIVNLSSQAGKRPLPNRSPYCASKSGVIGLTRVAAKELGPYNITVNAVCPGAVSGPRLDHVHSSAAQAQGISMEEYRKQVFESSPLHRPVPPEEIAEMILFLSDAQKSNSITGEDVNINCGRVMY